MGGPHKDQQLIELLNYRARARILLEFVGHQETGGHLVYQSRIELMVLQEGIYSLAKRLKSHPQHTAYRQRASCKVPMHCVESLEDQPVVVDPKAVSGNNLLRIYH